MRGVKRAPLPRIFLTNEMSEQIFNTTKLTQAYIALREVGVKVDKKGNDLGNATQEQTRNA